MRVSRSLHLPTALVGLLLLGACDELPLDPDAAGEPVALALQVSSSTDMVDVIVVEVTGPGIPVPILANLQMVDGTASGTISVPAGRDRDFTARGFDAQGGITHEGSVTQDVRPGMGTVRLPLFPLGVGVPMEVEVSSYVLSIEPETAELDAGQAFTLAATVRDAAGIPLEIDPAELSWASSNPAVARVERLESGDGEVTGWYQGTAQIGVSYRGVAAHATVVVDGIVPVTVSAGWRHTCGLTISGTAYCWGSNQYGQLGDGTHTADIGPTLVAGGNTFVSIAAGTSHTCGITTTGDALCWGRNSSGQVGDGTTADRAEPSVVSGGHTFSSIATGSIHTCAINLSGSTLCWGSDDSGRLGDWTVADNTIPNVVSGGHTFILIAAGGGHTCGITSSGTAYCWGRNVDGQLGDSNIPHSAWATPVEVSGEYTFASVAAGSAHTCGLTTNGTAYCWGRNHYGQLGDGTSTTRRDPTAVPGGLAFRTIVAGGHQTCGITPTGTSYCWGQNENGQLGDGTTTNQTLARIVAGSHGFVSVAAGGLHTCGTTTSGAVLCWGLNSDGQLGDGTTEDRHTPTPVSGWTTLP
jgi:alpha-tubulin suppressor-like RCC1 family protein